MESYYEHPSASTSQLQLPSYSPSLPSPDYSFKPACGEQLLEQTPQSSRVASSLFIKKAGKTTIVLNEQEDGATIPVYGRHAEISGNLFLEHSESILDITLKLEGKLETTISEGGSSSTKLVSESYTLWSHAIAQSSPCPGQLEFSILLPTTFKYKGDAVPLPPSYNASYISVPSLFARAAYQMHFVITRVRHQKLGIWPKTKHILIPFTYLPRTRPNRPIIPRPCFFSSVKTSPEEWYQAVTDIKTRSRTADSINCHLFVPAGRIYGVADTIPFHIQISGNVCSLQELFAECLLDRVISTDSRNTVESSKPRKSKPLIRVYLLRQITVASARDKSWKNTIIGEGALWPIPPDLSSCCSSDSQCREGHIDWEGELRCESDVTVGGFVAANVTVKDFIILSISPPNPFTSQLLEMQMTIPMRLVTDSWAETTGPERSLRAESPLAA